MRHDFTALASDSLLLIVDVQQAMLKVIRDSEAVVSRVAQLARAAAVVNVPVAVTEHYKKGLGPTIPEVLGEVPGATVLQKEHFSACLEPDFLTTIGSFGRSRIILVGMEAHVCVLQTGLDLLKAGFQVHLVEDAVSSRRPQDRATAINLFRQAGAIITCTEIVIFQWACRSNTEPFRRILPIVK